MKLNGITRGIDENPQPSPAKGRLLDAALYTIRAKGYSATTVDDICRQAGVTKGSFFHHFKSKDDLALAAVAYWRAMTESFFASAPYHQAKDPLDRLLGYLDFRNLILTGDLPNYTCLLGTLVQEIYDTHPDIRIACEQALSAHIAELTRDVEVAKAIYAPAASWSTESVGNLIQATLQGSFILAKAHQDPGIIRENLEHLSRYLRYLFQSPEPPNVLPQVHAEEDEHHDASKSHYTD
jgi:TetR/AcrR family transcriptional repressor of nem operon